MDPVPSVRIDKWLWAVRIYKSRSIATAACDSGRVTIGGQRVKPSRGIKPGDVINAVAGDINRTIKVLALLEARVGARLVPDYMEDVTPPSELQKPRDPSFRLAPFRPKGTGRPTKKERRQWDASEHGG